MQRIYAGLHISALNISRQFCLAPTAAEKQDYNGHNKYIGRAVPVPTYIKTKNTHQRIYFGGYNFFAGIFLRDTFYEYIFV